MHKYTERERQKGSTCSTIQQKNVISFANNSTVLERDTERGKGSENLN